MGDAPVAPDSRWSIISPYQDQPSPPRDLIELALDAGQRSLDITFSGGGLVDRCNEEQRGWLNEWPGNHYRLLAALVDTLKPEVIVEVGTFTGMGALALMEHAPTTGRLVTFDIVPWTEVGEAVLRKEDFGPLEQRIGDLANENTFRQNADLLADGDLFFVDGPKDGVFEQRFLPRLLDLRRGQKPGLLVLDDIRLMNMVRYWHELDAPKLDITSFGHWSGTGLVRLG